MKIYFNANNKATRNALKECGVRNVMVAYKYVYASIGKYRKMFDRVFVVAGRDANQEKYYEWLKGNRENYDYAAQFDVFYDMKSTMKNLEKERSMGIDWTLPVLQENFMMHMSMLKPKPNDYICLGEVKGKLEMEDNMRRLPANMKWHGLAKGNFIKKNRMFESLDTSAWTSAAISKKTEIWHNNSSFSMFFGEKGRGLSAQLQHALSLHENDLKKVGIDKKSILDNDYYALLRCTIPLLFMPLCRTFGIYDDNFKI